MERPISRRGLLGIGGAVLFGLAGCTAAARSCGPGDRSISEITDPEAVGSRVSLRGTIGGTYRESASGRTWFNINDTSGTALVFPADDWRDQVASLTADQCVAVTGRVAETYEGEYTSCVDPGDSTCAFLSSDVKITDATWEPPNTG